MDRDIIKELTKWLEHYRAYVENHAGCDVFMPYDNTENAAEELYIKYIKSYQNQKAIECLKEMRESFRSEGYFEDDWYVVSLDNIDRIIDNKIKELEGGE